MLAICLLGPQNCWARHKLQTWNLEGGLKVHFSWERAQKDVAARLFCHANSPASFFAGLKGPD